MKKRIIACICLLSVFAAFAGCKNKSLYVDPKGNTYIAVLDENDNTILNDEGDIVVYQTDKNNEIVTDESGVALTQASVFPNQIKDGDYIQTPTYTMKLPSGWKAEESRNGVFTKKAANAQVIIDIIEDSKLNDYYNRTVEIFDKLKESEDAASITVEESKFDYVSANTSAYSFLITKKDDDGVMMKMVMLLFENGGNLYRFTCQCPEADYDKANFTEFYSAINYKNFSYYGNK